VQQCKTPADITRLGTILSVWAHPDDESYLAAGIMATAVANGQTVVCVTATRGEAGSQDEQKWPLATLGQVRTKELQAALREIGIQHHYWLDYADGGCRNVLDEVAVQRLKELIDRFKPDSILTFGPEGLTGHEDHATVSRWAGLAVAASSYKPRVYHAIHTHEQYRDYLKQADEKLNIFFNIDQPPLVNQADCAIYYTLPKPALDTKCRCITAMPSQTEVLFSSFGEEFFKQAFGTECFVLAK
jgi:LmbE family N-acetylglucosaminyl deacetylase